MMYYMFILDMALMLVLVLINVAFITLFERKILGYSQNRLGPNKPSLGGLLTPMTDAIKLFLKNWKVSLNSYKMLFLSAPFVALGLVLLLWLTSNFFLESLTYELSLGIVLMLLGLNVYPLMMMGWASNSKYTFLGSVRGVAQSISYEISLAFILLSVCAFAGSLSLSVLINVKYYFMLGSVLPGLGFMWMLSVLAESNRSPFDFAEGESELVSGFNTEYGGGGFALIFMAEYSGIYFLASLSVVLLAPVSGVVWGMSLISVLVFIWVWVRSTYPRYRYDMLMNLAWKSILPCSLFFFILSLSLV